MKQLQDQTSANKASQEKSIEEAKELSKKVTDNASTAINNLEAAKKVAEDNLKQTETNLAASFLKQIKDLETMIEARVKTAEATSKADTLNHAEIITNKVKEGDKIIKTLIEENQKKIRDLSEVTAANKSLQEKSLAEEKQLLISKIMDAASNAIKNVADLKKYSD